MPLFRAACKEDNDFKKLSHPEGAYEGCLSHWKAIRNFSASVGFRTVKRTRLDDSAAFEYRAASDDLSDSSLPV